ncbi:MAG: GWxTD domain-containing protein [bacterium]
MLKKSHRIIVIIGILILSITELFAAKINFNIDDGLFWESDGKSRWEFYYSFEENSLKYKKSDKGLLGELFIHVSIYSNIKLQSEKKWIVSHLIDESNLNVNKTMVGQKDFILQPGQYKINVFIQDVNDSSSILELNFDLLVRQGQKDKINVSSLQVSQNIENANESKDTWQESFRKNEFFVVPIPSLMFLANNQKLNSYIEISNPDKLGCVDITIKYRLYDIYENELFENIKFIKSEKNFLFDTNSMEISNIETGSYYLKATIIYPVSEIKDSITVEKKIYILNPDKVNTAKPQFFESLTFERSEFASLTDEQTEIEIAKIKPISSYQEIEQFDKLTTSDAKKRLLFRFWLNRDTDTNTVFNEGLFKYRELIKFADRFFSFSKTKGWQTDRGRILLKYGMPDEREQHPFYGETRSYESWFYSEIQGGVYFHFVDMTGYGRYEMVHSTAQNEIQYENWYNEYVLKRRSENDNSNEY